MRYMRLEISPADQLLKNKRELLNESEAIDLALEGVKEFENHTYFIEAELPVPCFDIIMGKIFESGIV